MVGRLPPRTPQSRRQEVRTGCVIALTVFSGTIGVALVIKAVEWLF
jgi:hypothetical protein